MDVLVLLTLQHVKMTIRIIAGGGRYAENADISPCLIWTIRLFLLALLIHRASVRVLKPRVRVVRKRIIVSGIKNVIMESLVRLMSIMKHKTGATAGVLALTKEIVLLRRAGVVITSGMDTRARRKPVVRGIRIALITIREVFNVAIAL